MAWVYFYIEAIIFIQVSHFEIANGIHYALRYIYFHIDGRSRQGRNNCALPKFLSIVIFWYPILYQNALK